MYVITPITELFYDKTRIKIGIEEQCVFSAKKIE